MGSDHGSGRHTVQFYELDEWLYQALASFVTDAWRHASPAVLISRPRTFDAVLERLAADHDVAQLPQPLLFVDAEPMLTRIMHDGMPDPVAFSATVDTIIARLHRDSKDPIWFYGEMVDVLCRQGRHDAAIALEQIWSERCAGRPYAVLCGYALASFDGADDRTRFHAVCQAHSDIVPAEGLTNLSDDRGQRERIASLQHRARQRSTTAANERPELLLSRLSVVYIVDDDPGVRRSLARLLTSMDVRVETFPSAEAFLAEADKTAGGCLLLDMHLTEMSGVELQTRIAAAGWNLPVIAMSGLDDARTEATALRLGARGFLSKPFDPDAFIQMLARTSP